MRLIVFAFSDNLSAENYKLSAESGLPGLSFLECMVLGFNSFDILLSDDTFIRHLIDLRTFVAIFDLRTESADFVALECMYIIME